MTNLSPTVAGADAKTDRVDALFREYGRPGHPGAAVMVIHDGRVLLAKGYGLADVEKGMPCGTNTNFRLASVTKQFTAMSVMILAEQGKLSIDDQLGKFFPEFPNCGREVTVRQLLQHTSGLLDYEDLIPEGATIPLVDRNVLQLILKTDKTYFTPGTQYRYSNTGYSLLALIVEQVSGRTFAAFLREQIFRPLGMDNSVAYEAGLSSVGNRAYGHTVKQDKVERTDQSVTSAVLGDGGIYSSVSDLLKWDQALYTTTLVSAETIQAAFNLGIRTNKPETDYGFGWYLGQYRGVRCVWHSGGTIGFTTRIERYPERHFTVIILTNRRNAPIEGFGRQIADIYLFEAEEAGQ